MDAALDAASAAVSDQFQSIPHLAIVLGSGFQAVLESVEVETRILFSELPGFETPSVPGHKEAAIILGRLGKQRVILVSGRMHFYEGFSMEAVTLPVRTLAMLGVRQVLLTNAAGAIRAGMAVGDLMVVEDHINFTGQNPLRGRLGTGGAGFVDLCGLYSPRFNRIVQQSASKHGFKCHLGVYIGVSGPCFETPAEIRMFEQWGGDAVGMSTVAEAIAARQAGLEVGALSFLTNLAAGKSEAEIRHADVLCALEAAGLGLSAVLEDFCRLEAEGELPPP